MPTSLEIQIQAKSNGKGCSFCPNVNLDPELVLAYGETVCSHCKSIRSDYNGIIKSNAKKEFLLTDSLLEQLAFKEKPNPRNAFFKPMKIYLRKHVKNLAESLYGSLEKLEREKQKREENKKNRKRKKSNFFRGVEASQGGKVNRFGVVAGLKKKKKGPSSSVDPKLLEVENDPFKQLKKRRTFASKTGRFGVGGLSGSAELSGLASSSKRLGPSQLGLASRKREKERKRVRIVGKGFISSHIHKFTSETKNGKTIERCECGLKREYDEM
jgi:hypothetical protein